MRSAHFSFQVAMTLLFSAVAVQTMLFPAWLESFGIDPDHGAGTAEWLIVSASGVLVVVSVLDALSTRPTRVIPDP